MKLFKLTLRNTLALIVIIVLAAALIWLVRGQVSSTSIAQSLLAANTPVVTATFLPTDTPNLLPTATFWPTSNAVPVTTEPYPIFQVTPISGPTYTPTSTRLKASEVESPAVTVINRHELLLNRVASLTTQEEGMGEFQLLGWTQDNKVIIQKVFYQDKNGIPVQSAVQGPWQVSSTGETSSLLGWSDPSHLSQIQEDFINGLIAKNMLPDNISYWDTIPSNQYLAITPILGKIYIYKPKNNEPITILPDDAKLGGYIRYGALPVWSPNGKNIVYSVALIDPITNSPTDVKVMITEIATAQTTEFDFLPSTNIDFLTWAPDGSYIAFIASLSKQAPTHLYVLRNDGTGQTDLTPELEVVTRAFWSPKNDLIAYIDGEQNIFVLQLSRN